MVLTCLSVNTGDFCRSLFLFYIIPLLRERVKQNRKGKISHKHHHEKRDLELERQNINIASEIVEAITSPTRVSYEKNDSLSQDRLGWFFPDETKNHDRYSF